MRAITLRNVPPQIQRAIHDKARRKKISINKAVIELLQERVGIHEEKPSNIHADLDSLAGRWSATEAKRFEKVIGSLRRIDPELWH